MWTTSFRCGLTRLSSTASSSRCAPDLNDPVPSLAANDRRVLCGGRARDGLFYAGCNRADGRQQSKERLEQELLATVLPSSIVAECLQLREGRQGIDLVADDVEAQLGKVGVRRAVAGVTGGRRAR